MECSHGKLFAVSDRRLVSTAAVLRDTYAWHCRKKPRACPKALLIVSQMRASSGNAAQLAPGAARRTHACTQRHGVRPAAALAAWQQQQQLVPTALRPAAPAAWTQLAQHGGSWQQRRARSVIAASSAT